MAVLLCLGLSLMADDKKKFFEETKAMAEKGDRVAQFNLGVMYYNGKGVLQDYATAYAWANIAQANGEKNAQKMKSAIQTFMTPEQIAEGQKLSREMVKKNPKLIKE